MTVLSRRSFSFRRLSRSLLSCQYRLESTVRQLGRIDNSFGKVEPENFKEATSELGKPVILSAGKDDSSHFPAASKWFSPATQSTEQSLSDYMWQFRNVFVPFELIGPSTAIFEFHKWLARTESERLDLAVHLEHSLPFLSHKKLADGSPGREFHQFHGPLETLIAAVEFNKQAREPLKELYIAQAQLSDLPPKLSEDVPTPVLVTRAGKGDIYNSSLWLGLEPTYTPLHRDPNHNLFCQLCGRKTVRLTTPQAGRQLYARVKRVMGESGNSYIRGSGMMEGEERRLMDVAVWGCSGLRSGADDEGFWEATVEPGDALFIPLGWWHSVRSSHEDGRLNASVNWWFR